MAQVRLVPIDDEARLSDCEGLKRKSTRYVGGAMWLIGLAYVHRDKLCAYGVYDGDTLVGLALLNETNGYKTHNYNIAEMIIGDKFQRRGYGTAAVRAIIERFQAGGNFPKISLAVHRNNKIAIHMYEKCGFIAAGKAEWDDSFLVMEYTL